jgi:peptidoglycan/LPS O-acetylase OafA/YrhL
MPGEIRTLTYLRAFAAWLVVFYHLNHMFPQKPISFLEGGGIGVDVFFVLSGYVLTHVYLHEFLEGHFAYSDFLIKRFARIYPVHFFTLLAAVALTVGHDSYKMHSLSFSLLGETSLVSMLMALYQLFLLHSSGIFPIGFLNAPSWSISAEWLAYLLFPLFLQYVTANKARPVAVILTALFLSALIDYLTRYVLGRPLLELSSDFGFLRIIPCFLLGCCLRASLTHYSLFARWPLIAAISTFIVLFVVARYQVQWICLVIIGMGIIGLVELETKLNHEHRYVKALHYLGRISYSTYMVHYFAVFMAGPFIVRWGASWAIAVLITIGYIIVVFLSSVLSFHLIEEPFRRRISGLRKTYLGTIAGPEPGQAPSVRSASPFLE